MICDVDYDSYDKKEKSKCKPEEYDFDKVKNEHDFDKMKKESECGRVEIKAENVYIIIKCEKEKKEY